MQLIYGFTGSSISVLNNDAQTHHNTLSYIIVIPFKTGSCNSPPHFLPFIAGDLPLEDLFRLAAYN